MVDNASTDKTPAVIDASSSSLPLRTEARVIERAHPRPARGERDLLNWTDDDFMIKRDWLTKYRETSRRILKRTSSAGRWCPS